MVLDLQEFCLCQPCSSASESGPRPTPLEKAAWHPASWPSGILSMTSIGHPLGCLLPPRLTFLAGSAAPQSCSPAVCLAWRVRCRPPPHPPTEGAEAPSQQPQPLRRHTRGHPRAWKGCRGAGGGIGGCGVRVPAGPRWRRPMWPPASEVPPRVFGARPVGYASRLALGGGNPCGRRPARCRPECSGKGLHEPVVDRGMRLTRDGWHPVRGCRTAGRGAVECGPLARTGGVGGTGKPACRVAKG